MTESSKLYVEIEAPEHGWTHVKLKSGNSFYQFFPSDVPVDSISELAKAIVEILSVNKEATVYWNDEPVVHNFVFKIENEQCDFKVYEVFESIVGEKLIERFSFNGTKQEVLRPFWKALCDLKSKQSLEEYEAQWNNPFPAQEVVEIKHQLKSLKDL